MRVSRANFLPASIIPFLIGSAYAARAGYRVSPWYFCAGLIFVAAAHLTGNIVNEFYDFYSGADAGAQRKSPFFGGSRAIQDGTCSPLLVRRYAIITTLSALLVLSLAAYGRRDAVLFLLGSAGIFLAIEYTAPPFRFAYRGLGEAAIFFLFGIGLIMGSAYLFTGVLSSESFFLALPVSFLICAVILCNEIPDLKGDARAFKNTLVSLIGAQHAVTLYAVILACAFMSIIVLVLRGTLPRTAFFLTTFLLAGARNYCILRKKNPSLEEYSEVSKMTIMMHALISSGIAIFLFMDT